MIRVTNETTKKIGVKLIHANPLPARSPKRISIKITKINYDLLICKDTANKGLPCASQMKETFKTDLIGYFHVFQFKYILNFKSKLLDLPASESYHT